MQLVWLLGESVSPVSCTVLRHRSLLAVVNDGIRLLLALPVSCSSFLSGPANPSQVEEVNDKIRELFATAVPGKCYTLEEIGDYAGITKERVRQIEMKALKKLRLCTTIRQLKKECYS